VNAVESRVDQELLRASRKQMLLDSFGLSLSTIGFGLVYGLAAREVGLSPVDVLAMSVLVFAGGAQFAVLGYIGAGAPWLSIVVVTALINARHLLYGAVLAPYVANLPVRVRAAMAYPLSDETFAFTLSHFRRIGYADVRAYFLLGLGLEVGPWVLATVVGTALAGSIAEPAVFGLDVIFPAAMAGLAVGMVTGRRELAAAIAGALVGVVAGLLVDPAVGIVSGAVVGPIVGLLIPLSQDATEPEVSAP
jgi:4-azaleucine resistance transporter AzlC